MNQTRILGIAALAALAVNATAISATQAHIDMLEPLKGREGNQKAGPCEGKPRGPVYTFEPGATIKLEVKETVSHAGYFRISFDDDGFDNFKDPVSIDPLNPDRWDAGAPKCLSPGDPRGQDNCGKSDFCNVISKTGGPSVLWDNLDPHVPAGFRDVKNWSWNVTLPNVECDNCTLQIQQIMEDPAGVAHGPFDGKNDLYYRCVDIVLKKGAGNTPGTVTTPAEKPNNGIECAKVTSTGDAGAPRTPAASADAGTAPVLASIHGSDDSTLDELDGSDAEASAGGCSLGTTAGARASSAFGLLLAIGALVARRRKPRG